MELDDFPTTDDTTKVIEQVESVKVAEVERIPSKIWKHEGPALHIKLHICKLELGKVQDLHDSVIITLYKSIRDKSDCSNYLGITLLFIRGKIFARIQLNRFVPTIAKEHLPKSHCSFSTNRYVCFLAAPREVSGAKQGGCM